MQLLGFVKKVVSVMSSSNTDIEKGFGRPQTQEFSSTTDGTQHGAHGPTIFPNERDPHVQALLNEYRHYVGIQDDPDFTNGRPPNQGIYRKLIKYEMKYKKSFNTFSWLINSALGMQIVLAAALTALGAGDGPRSAVTAFGAINTVIAGFLTYLKGSGLPNRYEYYKNEVVKVREYIEQRERELSRGDLNLDLKEEVAIIEEMYQNVKRDIEMNNPDSYISRTKPQEVPQSDRGVSRAATRARRDYDDRMYDVDEKIGSVRRGLESRMSEARLGADAMYRGVRPGLEERLSQARLGVESRLAQERLGLDARLSGARQGLDTQYQQTRQGVDSQYQQTRQGLESQYQHTRAGVGSQIDAAKLATASQVETTRHDLETRIEGTRSTVAAQVEDSRHGVESRLQEVQAQVKEQEDKIMGIAESVAEKVLAVTQKRHEQEQR